MKIKFIFLNILFFSICGFLFAQKSNCPAIYQKQDICVVTVDQIINKAVVVWEKTRGLGIKSFLIYKLRHNGLDQWDVADTIPFNNQSIWTDKNSNPDLYPESYKIAVMDSCGNISNLSRVHSSIYFRAVRQPQGMPYTEFHWTNPIENPYDDFYKYELYGGDTISNLKLFNSGNLISGGGDTTSLSADWDPSSQYRYYYIIYIKRDSCNPEIIKKGVPVYGKSISNLEDLGAPECKNPPYIWQQQICLTTVDHKTNKVVVVWEKILNDAIKSFLIYKLRHTGTNQWDIVANIPYRSETVWTDPYSNPDLYPESYKIATIDTCGNISNLSMENKSIYLTAKTILNNDSVNQLSWNFPNSSRDDGFYLPPDIYGGSTKETMRLFRQDEISIIYDSTYKVPKYRYYYIAYNVKDTCFPSIFKKGVPVYSRSVSNLEDLGASFCFSIPYADQKICMVTIDTVLNKNVVVWDKLKNKGIEFFYIYKYKLNGDSIKDVIVISSHMAGVWLDSSSTPDKESADYRIGIIDTCGNVSKPSPYSFRSVHLSVAKDNNEINFQWNHPIDDPTSEFTRCLIYGGNDSLYLTLLSTITDFSTKKTFLTSDPSSHYLYYRIIYEKISICNPTLKKGNSNYYYQIKSNLFNTGMLVGIGKYSLLNESILLYPNPVRDLLSVMIKNQSENTVEIELKDVLGNTLLKQEWNITSNKQTFNLNLSGLSRGFYFIKLNNGNTSIIQKIILN